MYLEVHPCLHLQLYPHLYLYLMYILARQGTSEVVTSRALRKFDAHALKRRLRLEPSIVPTSTVPGPKLGTVSEAWGLPSQTACSEGPSWTNFVCRLAEDVVGLRWSLWKMWKPKLLEKGFGVSFPTLIRGKQDNLGSYLGCYVVCIL